MLNVWGCGNMGYENNVQQIHWRSHNPRQRAIDCTGHNVWAIGVKSCVNHTVQSLMSEVRGCELQGLT